MRRRTPSLWNLFLALVLALLPLATLADDQPTTRPEIPMPSECHRPLPTAAEAKERLRALGVPERTDQASPAPAEPDEYASVPAGKAVTDPAVRRALPATLREWIACWSFGPSLAYAAFMTDSYLRKVIPSIVEFEQAIDPIKFDHGGQYGIAIWSIFGERHLDDDRLGVFAEIGSSAVVYGVEGRVSSVGFFILVRQGGDYFIDETYGQGDTCLARAEAVATPSDPADRDRPTLENLGSCATSPG